MRKRTGYLFRRANGKHISIDDPDHQSAKIYLCYMVNYERKTISMRTNDKRTAEVKAAKLMGGMAFSDHENYLLHLIEMGEMAKRELSGEHKTRLQTKIKDVMESYIASKERPNSSQGTLTQYTRTWNRFADFLPATVIHIEDVTKHMCERYIDDLEENYKRASCRKFITQLNMIFKTISTKPSPFERLKTMKPDDTEQHRQLTHEECKRLVSNATGEMRTAIIIGYYTGLRATDCIHIRWSNINFDTRIITINPAKGIRKRNNTLHIPITSGLYEHLKSIKETDSKYVLPKLAQKYDHNDSLFFKQVGRLFNNAEISHSEEGKATFHSLRVTFQSMNDNAGTSRVITRSITGHTSAKMSDIYSRVDIDRAREALENAIPELG